MILWGFSWSAYDPDREANSGALVFSILQGPQNGRLVGNLPNASYVPNVNFSGEDYFSFEVSDGFFDPVHGEVRISVAGLNDAPTVPDLYFQTTADQSVSFNLKGEDVDGDDLTYVIMGEPSYGNLTFDGENYVYSTSVTSAVVDTFSYVADDGNAQSELGIITVYIGSSDASLVAENQQLSVDEDQSVTTLLTALYSGLQDDLQFELLDSGDHGMATLVGNQLDYTPSANFFGVERLLFKVSDIQGNVSIGEVFLTINPINDPP